jgi:hypothetical protein
MMRAWGGVTTVAVAGLLVGCGRAVDTTPLPTDGPNQVVLSVPGMT